MKGGGSYPSAMDTASVFYTLPTERYFDDDVDL